MAGTTDAQALLLTINADTSKALKAVEALNKRLAGIAPEMEAHARRGAKAVEEGLGSINVKRALDKVFDSSKLAVIEEGSTKLRIFGSAIEPLGPLGIAAAAGVVALGAAFEESRKAIEYADSLYKAAQPPTSPPMRCRNTAPPSSRRVVTPTRRGRRCWPSARRWARRKRA
jgi:hypothetical protein